MSGNACTHHVRCADCGFAWWQGYPGAKLPQDDRPPAIQCPKCDSAAISRYAPHAELSFTWPVSVGR